MGELDFGESQSRESNPAPTPINFFAINCWAKRGEPMMLIWRWIKIWLFIGMLYAVYYLIRSALALKRVEISRNSWDAKS
jgi:hypothetical protein